MNKNNDSGIGERIASVREVKAAENHVEERMGLRRGLWAVRSDVPSITYGLIFCKGELICIRSANASEQRLRFQTRQIPLWIRQGVFAETVQMHSADQTRTNESS